MKNIFKLREFDLELFFATDVLKLDSLHYGMWKKGEKLSLANVKKAQKRYTDTLLQMLPGNIKTVLDVGSGTGEISRALAKRGYCVTAISPDVNHQQFYDRNPNPRIKFYNVKFEDFSTDEKYDLVLMAESNGYIKEDFSIKRSYELLNPGGYLFLSGLFRNTQIKKLQRLTNFFSYTEKRFISKASKMGFKVFKKTDITDDVFPTILYAYDFFKKYARPSLELVTRYFKYSDPLKFRILSLLFRKQIQEISTVLDYYEGCINPRVFLKNVRYLRIILKKN